MGNVRDMIGRNIVTPSDQESVKKVVLKKINSKRRDKEIEEWKSKTNYESEFLIDDRTGAVTYLRIRKKVPEKSLKKPIRDEQELEKNMEMAKKEIKKKKNLFGIRLKKNQDFAEDNFNISGISEDVAGGVHIRLRQTYQEIPIQGSGSMVVHIDNDDYIYGIDSDFKPNIKLDIRAKIGEDEAKEGIGKSADALNVDSNFIGEPMMVILIIGKTPHLAWKVEAKGNKNEPWLKELYLDAHTGKLIEIKDYVYRFGNNNRLWGWSYWEDKEVEVEVTPNDSHCEMVYCENGKHIIETSERIDDDGVMILDNDTRIVKISDQPHFDYRGNCPKAAIDCHRFTKKVIDYFKDEHQYDLLPVDAKMAIVSNAHKDQVKHAEHRGYRPFDYVLIGDIDDDDQRIWCSLDVIAHEWTHSLLHYKFDISQDRLYWEPILEGRDFELETNALREAICDAFGAFISGNWKIAKVYQNRPYDCERNMENPKNGLNGNYDKAHAQDLYNEYRAGPDHKDGFVENGFDEPSYLNCCIINKATYLMAEGGNDQNGNHFDGIGVGELGKLYFHVVTQYLGDNETFNRFGRYLLDAVEYLSGREIILQTHCRETIIKSFEAIGYDLL